MTDCPSGVGLNDPTNCPLIFEASKEPIDLYRDTEPTTEITAAILPDRVEQLLTECDGNDSCKFVAYDFQTEVGRKASSSEYTVDIAPSSGKSVGVFVKKTAETPIEMTQPPGFTFDPLAISGGTIIATPSTTFEEQCAESCRYQEDCVGFNFTALSGACELLSGDITQDKYKYVDGKVSFLKTNIPSVQTGDGSNLAGTYLENTGIECTDMDACNSNIARLVNDLTIIKFSTDDIKACSFCPTKKFHRTSLSVTNEIGVTKNYGADRPAAVNALRYKKSGPTTHIVLSENTGTFYRMTPYTGLVQLKDRDNNISTIQPSYYEVFIVKKNNKYKLFGIGRPEDSTSRILQFGIYKPAVIEWLGYFSNRYSLFVGTPDQIPLFAPSLDGYISLGSIEPVSYVTDGYVLYTDEGGLITSDEFTGSKKDGYSSRYSQEYNRGIFTFTQFTGSSEHKMNRNTNGTFDITYSNSSWWSRLLTDTTYVKITRSDGTIEIFKLESTLTKRKFADETMLQWTKDLNSNWVEIFLDADIVDEIFVRGTDMPDPYEALGQYRTFDIAPSPNAESWPYAADKKGCDKDCSDGRFMKYQCRRNLGNGLVGGNCDQHSGDTYLLDDVSCKDTYKVCLPPNNGPDMKNFFSYPISGLTMLTSEVVANAGRSLHLTSDLLVRTIYGNLDPNRFNISQEIASLLFPTWTRVRFVRLCPITPAPGHVWANPANNCSIRRCLDNHYCPNEATEISCSICEEGSSYETSACTPTTNRVCEPCSTCTAGSTYETSACTVTANRVCEPCSTCTAGSTYETSACTVTANRVCEPCSTCTAGSTYETSACTVTANRVCEPCTVCTLPNHQLQACTITSDSVCIDSSLVWSELDSERRLLELAFITGGDDATIDDQTPIVQTQLTDYVRQLEMAFICVLQCPAEYYQSESCTSTTEKTCTPCRVCETTTDPNEEIISSGCEGSTDRTCIYQCKSGFYKGSSSTITQTNKKPGTVTNQRLCAQCTTCSATQYQTRDCTPTQNRICADCSTTCPSGQYQTIDCTSTADRVCGDCTICDVAPANATLTESGCTGSTDRTCSYACNDGYYPSSGVGSSIVCTQCVGTPPTNGFLRWDPINKRCNPVCNSGYTLDNGTCKLSDCVAAGGSEAVISWGNWECVTNGTLSYQNIGTIPYGTVLRTGTITKAVTSPCSLPTNGLYTSTDQNISYPTNFRPIIQNALIEYTARDVCADCGFSSTVGTCSCTGTATGSQTVTNIIERVPKDIGRACPAGAPSPPTLNSTWYTSLFGCLCNACTAGSTYNTTGGYAPCSQCKTCSGSQYQKSDCTTMADRVCEDCKTCTAGSTYETSACTSTADRVCGNCTTCSGSQYQKSDCTTMADRVCGNCTTCSASQYQKSDCTRTADRVCGNCTTCSASQYQKSDCTRTADRVCGNCTTCSASQYQKSDCTTTADRVCGNCTTCSASQYQKSDCTTTADRVCEACTICDAAPANATLTESGCTGSTNRTCSYACNDGYYRSVTTGLSPSAFVCAACSTTCPTGQYISTACTRTANRVCTDCTTCDAAPSDQVLVQNGCDGVYNRVCRYYVAPIPQYYCPYGSGYTLASDAKCRRNPVPSIRGRMYCPAVQGHTGYTVIGNGCVQPNCCFIQYTPYYLVCPANYTLSYELSGTILVTVCKPTNITVY